MAYNPTKEQTIVISKRHHTMLKAIAELDKRKLKNTLELMIEKQYNTNNPS